MSHAPLHRSQISDSDPASLITRPPKSKKPRRAEAPRGYLAFFRLRYFAAAAATPAWSFSASALSVFSQVNESSVRPKCPNAAVFR